MNTMNTYLYTRATLPVSVSPVKIERESLKPLYSLYPREIVEQASADDRDRIEPRSEPSPPVPAPRGQAGDSGNKLPTSRNPSTPSASSATQLAESTLGAPRKP